MCVCGVQQSCVGQRRRVQHGDGDGGRGAEERGVAASPRSVKHRVRLSNNLPRRRPTCGRLTPRGGAGPRRGGCDPADLFMTHELKGPIFALRPGRAALGGNALVVPTNFLVDLRIAKTHFVRCSNNLLSGRTLCYLTTNKVRQTEY